MKTWTAEEIVAKFQYSFACTEESFDVDGFTVEIVRDECADNPHDRSDCESPAIWLHHGLHKYGDERLGERMNHLHAMHSLRYPFSVVRDANPSGGAWLVGILAEAR